MCFEDFQEVPTSIIYLKERKSFFLYKKMVFKKIHYLKIYRQNEFFM